MSILLHATWRTSSTYLFGKLRAPELNTYCYYEPYNDLFGDISEKQARSLSPHSWDSGHPESLAPYCLEYLPLLNPAGGVRLYDKAFAYRNFFPAGPLPQEEANYLRQLEAHAKNQGKIPVFGFCRSLGRVGHLRGLLPGLHVMQYRDPHEMITSVYATRLCSSVINAVGFIPWESPAATLKKRIPAAFTIQKEVPPLPPEESDARYGSPLFHALYFDFFVFVTIAGAFYADLIFDISRAARDTAYRADFEEELAARGGPRIRLDDITFRSPGRPRTHDPRLLQDSLEYFAGNRATLGRLKAKLESASGVPTVRSVAQVEALCQELLRANASGATPQEPPS